ncbi:MAG: endonuclease/exonuclease/phosphatase family protein [Gemmataceae bacterium]|nr:endonuclease/exonuclease/phosphatase family protein [Gemmataceae bacterium]
MFTAATWNVLATCHLDKGDYSRVPPALLDPAARVPAVARHAAALGADLLLLQEVEQEVYEALRAALPGFDGRLEFRAGRTEGCALLWRSSLFAPLDGRRFDHPGGDGRVSAVQVLETEGRRLGVACTHLAWDKPGMPASAQVGYRQAEALLAFLGGMEAEAWLVGGDFNRPPEGEVPALFGRHGFASAHAGREAPTFRSRGAPRQIDFLLATAALEAEPAWPIPLPDPMPCEGQPSDHLPQASAFRWRSVLASARAPE